MVLHNDKWAKKAKRAVERRKGIVRPGHHAGAASNEPAIVERMDMGRPTAEELEDVQDVELSSDSGSDSFEFDSGDEGKFIDKPVKPTTSEAQQVQGRTAPAWRKTAAPLAPVTQAIAKDNVVKEEADSTPTAKVDRRFARRKLVDNSSRYEEPVLDPYLQPVETEPEIDYTSLKNREFSNPREVELVPDAAKTRKTPQVMEDTTHFDRLRQLQQKVEYARDMKLRFGQRAGFERNKDNAVCEDDDDAFFASIANGRDEHKDTSVKRGSASTKPQADNATHEPLEKYLDDLLKL